MRPSLHEYAAVRHILTSPAIATRTAAHIREDDLDWVGLLDETETMSVGERMLVSIACSLWTAEGAVDLREVPRRLDARSFQRVITGLQLYRGDVSPVSQQVA